MTRYIVSSDAACAAVDDGTVVLNMRTKRYYSLNETGAVIWRMLESDGGIDAITERLVADYDVDRETAAGTVAELLDALIAEALIAREPA